MKYKPKIGLVLNQVLLSLILEYFRNYFNNLTYFKKFSEENIEVNLNVETVEYILSYTYDKSKLDILTKMKD